MLQGDQQRGFLHRVGAVQDHHARDRRIGQGRAHRVADRLHVGQRQGRAVLGGQFHRAQAQVQGRQQVQQVLPA